MVRGLLTEGKPWEETVAGQLNPGSYAAVAAFDLVELALAELHDAGQPITGRSVPALARTLAHVAARVQTHVTGSMSLQEAMNSRARYALKVTLRTMQLPFGADTDGWLAWTEAAARRCTSIAAAAFDLWENGPGDQPWRDLAGPAPDGDGPAGGRVAAWAKPLHADRPVSEPVPDFR